MESPRFIGPFQILKRMNKVTYRLQLPAQYRIISPSFHVSLLRPMVQGPLQVSDPSGSDNTPPAIVVEGSPAYIVRELIDSRRRGGRLQYLVDWEGYGPEERSWEAAVDVLDPLLVAN